MKLCKDCKHCVVEDGEYEYAKCAISVRRMDYVTGEKALYYCSTERLFTSNSCGPAGKMFEPIIPVAPVPKEPTLMQRIAAKLGGLFK